MPDKDAQPIPELVYTIRERDMEKLHQCIVFQAYRELERAFSLGKSELTSEEQAVLTEYKSQQIANNIIQIIKRGEY